ncbi:hypothetical protein D3C72_1971690 [compost metagenome]
MVVAEAAFRLVELRGGHPKVKQDAVNLGNSVLLRNFRQRLELFLKEAEIASDKRDPVLVSRELLPGVIQRPIVLIECDQPALVPQP